MIRFGLTLFSLLVFNFPVMAEDINDIHSQIDCRKSSISGRLKIIYSDFTPIFGAATAFSEQVRALCDDKTETDWRKASDSLNELISQLELIEQKYDHDSPSESRFEYESIRSELTSTQNDDSGLEFLYKRVAIYFKWNGTNTQPTPLFEAKAQEIADFSSTLQRLVSGGIYHSNFLRKRDIELANKTMTTFRDFQNNPQKFYCPFLKEDILSQINTRIIDPFTKVRAEIINPQLFSPAPGSDTSKCYGFTRAADGEIGISK